jgi:hypothetical protein
MIRKGQPGPHFKGTRIEIVRGKVRRISRWEGSEAECVGLIAGLRNSADYVSIDRIGDTPVWVVEAVFEGETPNDPNITDTFEMLFNTEQQPMLSSPKLNSLLTTTEIKFVLDQKKALDEATINTATGVSSFTDARARSNITSGVSNAGAGLNLYDNLLLGINSFFYDSPVFRVTRSFNWKVTQDPFYANSNKVYTSTGNMLSGEGWSVNFELPEAEWLKKSPQMRLQYEGQGEIIYEYWGADVWDRTLYYLV